MLSNHFVCVRREVCYIVFFSDYVGLLILLGSGWLLSMTLLIVFIVLYCKLRNRYRRFKETHTIRTHDPTPLPAIPYSSQISLTSTACETTSNRYTPQANPSAEVYCEIKAAAEQENGEDYVYPDSPPMKTAPVVPDYIDMLAC